MSDLPGDLVQLPTSPWDERPTELPLDIEECRTALWLDRGNVSKAAERLKVPAARLRAKVRSSKYLQAELEEASEAILDLAESVVYDALTDMQDPGRRDSMARFALTAKGGARGYGSKAGSGPSVRVDSPKGSMIITWGDGESILGGPKVEEDTNTIEGVGMAVNDR